ncbi:MAG: hypothetical protein U5K73_00645 [Halofilum sp. (in: g-proteobacteria)]|nr:hypothetical protein [Halofilum sp. (in: g-proteobacteria)]
MARLNAMLAPLALTALLLAGCEPVQEPWVSGNQADALEQERTRSAQRSQELRGRLQRYGGAYQ